MSKTNAKSNEKAFNAAARLAATPLLASLLSILIFASVTVIAVTAFAKDYGYRLLLKGENGEFTYQYSHYYADGDDEKLKEYDEANIYQEHIRELSDKTTTVLNIVLQVILALIFFMIIYCTMWPKGDRDRDRSDFGKIEGDPLYGLKLGCWASLPYLALYLLLVVEKIFETKFALTLFKFINFSFFSLIRFATENVGTAAEMPIWSFLPLLAVVAILPAVSHCGYSLGYRHISIKKKLMYEKNNGGR